MENVREEYFFRLTNALLVGFLIGLAVGRAVA